LSTSDQPEVTEASATVVGHVAAGNAIGPGKPGVAGHIIETAPERDHGLGDDVIHGVGVDPASHVALQWLVNLRSKVFEAATPRVGDMTLFVHGFLTSPRTSRFPGDKRPSPEPFGLGARRVPEPDQTSIRRV
jgi:hypothetical protein